MDAGRTTIHPALDGTLHHRDDLRSLTQQSTIDVWGRIFWGVAVAAAGAGGEECELPKKKS